MSDNMMNPINRIVAETASSISQPTQVARPVAKPAEQKAPPKTTATGSATRLQFRMDEKTNEVTIMIVDKASDKIIRTIPPEAIKDLPTGELLQYSR